MKKLTVVIISKDIVPIKGLPSKWLSGDLSELEVLLSSHGRILDMDGNILFTMLGYPYEYSEMSWNRFVAIEYLSRYPGDRQWMMFMDDDDEHNTQAVLSVLQKSPPQDKILLFDYFNIRYGRKRAIVQPGMANGFPVCTVSTKVFPIGVLPAIRDSFVTHNPPRINLTEDRLLGLLIELAGVGYSYHPGICSYTYKDGQRSARSKDREDSIIKCCSFFLEHGRGTMEFQANKEHLNYLLKGMKTKHNLILE